MTGNVDEKNTAIAAAGFFAVLTDDYRRVARAAKVRIVNGSTAAIGPARITIENGNVYTAIARDPDSQGTNDSPGLILMDDFVTQ